MAQLNGMVGGGMRSILKLMRANIRHGKGSFKGIAFMMMLITFSFSGTVSNDDRLTEARTQKFADADIADVIVEIYDDLLTADMRSELDENEHVADYSELPELVFLSEPEVEGEAVDTRLVFKRYDSEDTRVFSDDGKTFLDDNSLENGEILLPYKMHLTGKFKKGAKVTLKTKGGYDEEFTVKGYYEDILWGATTTSKNSCVMNCEDFDRIRSDKLDNITDEERNVLLSQTLSINTSGNITPLELRSELSKNTSLISSSSSAFTRDLIIDMIEMYSNVGTRTTFVFVVLLLIVILITMHNSISASIEMEYTELGILKSQGFTTGQISLVYIFQYILALVIGSAAGILVSIPALDYMIGKWKNITGIMTCTNVSYLKCSVMSVAIILICLVFILISTAKIGRISPVRAISGGGSEVHFDSRLNIGIRQKPLSFFLAVRQLNSRRRNYLGTLLITSLLEFFIVTIMILTHGLDIDTLFHEITGEISIKSTGGMTLDNIDAIEEDIRDIDSGAIIESESYHYMLIDGEQTAVHAYRSKEDVFKPMEGRVPKYDNEIMITEGVSEQCGKKIGDTVTVSYLDNEEEFVITGYFQSIWDFGLVTQVTPEGMSKLGNKEINLSYVRLDDMSKKDEIISMLGEKYSGKLEAKEYIQNENVESYKNVAEVIMDALTIAMYVIVLSFAAVIVNMVCKRSFIRERTDIGIFKATGFTSGSLRAQFSLRFAALALLGSGIGCVLSILWSRKILTYILRIIGLTDFTTNYALSTFIVPAAVLSVCFLITALFASRRIKSVEVRELITE